MRTSLSIDIEACGTIVLSIGVCKFNEEDGEILDSFYGVPPIQEQLERGLSIDARTFSWWLKQSEKARLAICNPTDKTVKDMLTRLENFCKPNGMRTWAYPTSYDLPIIAHLCERFGSRPPWKWVETMDARTLWQLAKEINPSIDKNEVENPIPHHALEDSKEQARWIVAYLKVVRGK